MTRSSMAWVPFLLLPLLAGCQTVNETADFATNDIFYVDVPWKTKAPGDRPVFVAPVTDARGQTPLPTRERGFPIRYGADDFWERPVTDMVGDVLQRQLQSSSLFTEVAAEVRPESLVLKPTLVAFSLGATSAISGERSFAEIGLRLQVLGPAGADGQRPVLHEQTYGNRQLSVLEVNPVSPYRLVGRALQMTMQRALAGLDGSNVARSNVPAAVVPGAPVAVPAATTQSR